MYLCIEIRAYADKVKVPEDSLHERLAAALECSGHEPEELCPMVVLSSSTAATEEEADAWFAGPDAITFDALRSRLPDLLFAMGYTSLPTAYREAGVIVDMLAEVASS